MTAENNTEPAGTPSERFWEAHYGAHERVWSGRANAHLVDIAGNRPPGSALDLGCAEGADAIWLAGRGWRVTAVDVSATALQRASTHAVEAGVEDRIVFQRHDLAHTFPTGVYDLVSAQYLQSPVEFPRDRVLQAAARSVAPGGLLLVVTHASIAPWSWNQDPDTRFPTPDEELAALTLSPNQWRTEMAAAPARQAIGPGGQSATVIDNVIAVRRITTA